MEQNVGLHIQQVRTVKSLGEVHRSMSRRHRTRGPKGPKGRRAKAPKGPKRPKGQSAKRAKGQEGQRRARPKWHKQSCQLDALQLTLCNLPSARSTEQKYKTTRKGCQKGHGAQCRDKFLKEHQRQIGVLLRQFKAS